MLTWVHKGALLVLLVLYGVATDLAVASPAVLPPAPLPRIRIA